MDHTSKVIISASGMCDAGRIRHHLKHNLWRKECSIVFVGYQGEGTLGRRLLDGVPSVRMFGEEIEVNAKIHNFKGLSSHADRDHLLGWIKRFTPKPKQVFVVHGDDLVTEVYAQTLRDLGLMAHAPLYEEVFDLAANRMLAPGVELEPKKKKVDSHVSAAYHELESVAMEMLALVHKNKGSSNKDLRKMTNHLKSMMERFS